MRWERGRNRDVIDARGGGGGTRGGRVALPGGLGLVGVIVFVAFQLLGGGATFDVPAGFDGATRAPAGAPIPAGQDPDRDLKEFSGYVFNDVQDTWAKTFAAQDRTYERAKLYLYASGVDTGCGSATSAVGPFYCPADRRVYLDLSFYREMEQRLQAGGDFAWAYVIAHEVGHHVQQQLGTSDEVRRLEGQRPEEANELSVRLELQADCYSGVWAKSAYEAGELQPGDIEEAFRASEAVGDDRLQRQATGRVDPDTFTHGTSAQRRHWFDTGRQAGEPAACDTFTPESVRPPARRSQQVHLAGAQGGDAAVGAAHEQPAVGVDPGARALPARPRHRRAVEGVAAAQLAGGVRHRLGEPVLQRVQELRQHRLHVGGRAAERAGPLPQRLGQLSGVDGDVDAQAQHRPALLGPALGQHAGHLAPVEQHVVGPLDPRRRSRDVGDRQAAAQREQAVGRAHDERAEDGAPGRRDPRAALAAAARGLRGRAHERAVGGAPRREPAGDLVGGGGLEQVQARAPERAHAGSSRSSSPPRTPSSAAASPPLTARASAPPASS
jgi:predicted metalloprotease